MIKAIQMPVFNELRQLKPTGVIIGEPMARTRSVDGASPNPAADLTAAGSPVDAGKVAAVRTAIARGSYRIDAVAIAERMVDLDLPQ